MTAAIKALFRDAATALMGSDQGEDEPERRGKKDGESERHMMRFARRFLRLLRTKQPDATNTEMRDSFREARAAITEPTPEDFLEAAGAPCSDPFDQISGLFSTDAVYVDEIDGEFGAIQDHYVPQL
jgi:hypothetical protein